MASILSENAPAFIGIFLVIGGLLHVIAWGELEEFHWFDIIMREGPLFEDLSEKGQLLVIASWICAIAAVGIAAWVYGLPRLQ